MEFSCYQSDIITAVNATDNITGIKSDYTTLSNVLLESKENNLLSIKASNTEISIITLIAADIKKQGKVSLFQRSLIDFLKYLPNDKINFLLNADGKMTISVHSNSKKSDAYFNTTSGDEFPEIQTFPEDDNAFTLDKLSFKETLMKIAFVTSKDSTRYSLNGALFDYQKGSLSVVSTDGRRMAIAKKDYNLSNVENLRFIIPNDLISLLIRNIQTEGTLHVNLKDDLIFIRFDQTQITAKRLSGQFPDYHKLIPEQFEKSITVEKESLLSSLNQSSVAIDKESNRITFEISQDKLYLLGQGSEHVSSKIEIDIVNSSESSLKFALNFRLFMELLKNIDTQDIEIKLNKENQPIQINPVGIDDYTYVIMPMLLND